MKQNRNRDLRKKEGMNDKQKERLKEKRNIYLYTVTQI